MAIGGWWDATPGWHPCSCSGHAPEQRSQWLSPLALLVAQAVHEVVLRRGAANLSELSMLDDEVITAVEDTLERWHIKGGSNG